MSITYYYIITLDIDECKDPSLHLYTGQNLKCVNQPGNYSRKCAPGYKGDGIDCKESLHKQCKQFLEKAQRRKVQSILFLQTLATNLKFQEIKAKDIRSSILLTQIFFHKDSAQRMSGIDLLPG